jgi:Tol biopolymer transport system component
MKNSTLVLRNALLSTVGLCLAVPALAAQLQVVSTIDAALQPPAGGGGDSCNPIISPDGRYVLFASRANNLALVSSNTPFLAQVPTRMNVFLRDRTNGTTTLLSVNLSGTGGGNGDSFPTGLSTNGQYALFESDANNLVAGDTNNAMDIFVRDVVNGATLLVSVGTNGGCGNGASHSSVMTPDGRYVAFCSAASDLVPDDTNGIPDIFVRDLQSGVTTLASPGALRFNSGASSDSPVITPDGHYVAFQSWALFRLVYFNLNAYDVYVGDLVGNKTALASTNAHILFPGSSYSYSFNHVISDDGQFVAFESFRSGSTGVVQRCNLQTGFTDNINSNAVVPLAGYNYFRSVDMTSDGRFVAFVASTNTGSGTTTSCVFIWDAQTSTTTLVSADTNNAVPTNSVCDWPTLDASGRYVAFLSTATNLTTNVLAGDLHLYVRDLQAGATTLVDAGTNGAGVAKDFLSAPRLTPDGRFVAFECSDADLVANGNNHASDVFVRDLAVGTTELISVRQPTLPTQTPSGIVLSPALSVSADGRYVAFCAAGNGLLAGGYTNTYRGVFVRDLLNGTNILVSVDTNGLAGADGMSTDPAMSSNGRYVAFTSVADNLVAGDVNNAQDVFVRDLLNGTTTLASVNTSGAHFGSSVASYLLQISSDGRYVLFRNSSLYWRDLQSVTSRTVGGSWSAGSMTPDGRFVAYGSGSANMYVWDFQLNTGVYSLGTPKISTIAISPDGNRIAALASGQVYLVDRAANTNWTLASSGVSFQFSGDSRFLVYCTAAAQVANDTNGLSDIYLYDYQTQSNLLVSQSYAWAGAANGASDSPVLSADGRFIAYRSAASDIVPGDTNGVPDVFLYDRQTGMTLLLSVSALGDVAGNNRSLFPAMSGDGQTVVFQSWASDLVGQDFNQGADVFAWKFYSTTNAAPPFAGQMVAVPTSGQAPTLAWQSAAGKTYAVQFKDELDAPDWQPLVGVVRMVGGHAYATDLAPNPNHRFYRIVAY